MDIKKQLDKFLWTIPDQSKLPHYYLTGANTGRWLLLVVAHQRDYGRSTQHRLQRTSTGFTGMSQSRPVVQQTYDNVERWERLIKEKDDTKIWRAIDWRGRVWE
ncbi:hypothetical protein Pcinc_036241 [Petrolisthes cinctipes]|uniref:Uncharacterized protein n=1 Tax=Petrolisthes cinctipes TaxID=88211 RepID=A0AAE1BUU1_PETCI|nr:hypothetical protein Pcinc_036241 [Petrolisthes cinctipes]